MCFELPAIWLFAYYNTSTLESLPAPIRVVPALPPDLLMHKKVISMLCGMAVKGGKDRWTRESSRRHKVA